MMNLVDELRNLTRKAKESKDTDYLSWRKRALTPKFFQALKKNAEKGKESMKVPDYSNDGEHWERWAREHGFDCRGSKVWWTINA
jgi:hypothetical protein